MASRAPAIGAVILAALACRSEPAPGGQPAATQTPAAVAADRSAPSAEPPKPAAPPPPKVVLSEQEARALLSAWLDAQNAGRIEDYAKLYAERFEGVKRVGARARRYDRKHWLADRQRMFGKPMAVEANDVTVRTTASGAVIRFEQRWRSGTFEDVGVKEMVLVARADGASGGLAQARRGGTMSLIVREDMLSSEVKRNDVRDLALSDFMLVLHTASTYVVVSRSADPAWGKGRPLFDWDPESNVVATRMDVDAAAVPPAIRSALPEHVRGYDGRGMVCSGHVRSLSLLRRVVPPWGTHDEWRKLATAQAAAQAWDEASEPTLLVAKLESKEGCEKALWARAEGRPEPVVFAREDAGAELVPSVVRAVRALPGYRSIEREYRAAKVKYIGDPLPARWDEIDDATPTIALWRGGGRTFVSYDISVGECSELGGALWAIFEQRDGELKPIGTPGADDLPGALEVSALFDADGDGALEILGRGFANPDHEADVVVHGVGERLMLVSDLSPPFHDCGC